MAELKTLKDIAEDIEEEFGFFSMNEATIKSFQTIKQEAIKWVKNAIIETRGNLEDGWDQFMEFFNLTEEDLK
jgi:hypothetical protein